MMSHEQNENTVKQPSSEDEILDDICNRGIKQLNRNGEKLIKGMLEDKKWSQPGHYSATV